MNLTFDKKDKGAIMNKYTNKLLVLVICLSIFCFGFRVKPKTKDGEYLMTLWLEGKFDIVISESEKLLAKEPNSTEIRTILALAYLTNKQPDEAVSQAKIILHENERDITANEIVMYSLVGKGNFEEALNFAKKILQFDPNNAEAHYVIGGYYLEKGDEESLRKSVEYLLKAASLEPKKELIASDNVINVYMKLGEFEKAKTLAQEIYKKFSDKNFLEANSLDVKKSVPDVIYILSIFYARENNAKGSLNFLRQVIEVDNDFKARAKKNRDLFEEVGKSKEFEELIK